MGDGCLPLSFSIKEDYYVSFKTMTEANQAFVTKLYGLKAGLSLLAIQSERMQVAEEHTKFVKDCLENKRNDLLRAKQQLGQRYDAKVKAEGLLQIMRGKMILPIVGSSIPIGIALLMLIAIMGFAGACHVSGDMELLDMLPMFLIADAIAFLFGAFMIFSSIRKHSTKRYSKALDVCTLSWGESRKQVAELSKELEKEEAAYEQHCTEHEKLVAEIEERTKSIYNALLEEYDDILDHRDWGSVDYLIYVYETMRADTLPAALDKLDTEKRAGQLEAAIKEASECIAGSIEENMKLMGDRLSMCLSDLGSRMEASNRKVAASINAASAEASRQAAAMNAGIAAQNALLAKANVSSASIAKDVGYMVDRYKLYGSL